MQYTRVHNLNVSLDGFAAGEEVTLDHPIGGAEALFKEFDGRWIGGTKLDNGPLGLPSALTTLWGQGIGAEIMGRRKFGPQTGPWQADDDWKGWWGDEPPFATPTYILTHHPHEQIDFANGTSFRFIDATPAEALKAAQEAANGLDVRIGGGPSTVRQFLDADLIDFMHLAIQPIVLGRGVSLWDGLDDLHERFLIESVSAANGVVHQFWNRKRD
jgi:dihydrofolate reductase